MQCVYVLYDVIFCTNIPIFLYNFSDTTVYGNFVQLEGLWPSDCPIATDIRCFNVTKNLVNIGRPSGNQNQNLAFYSGVACTKPMQQGNAFFLLNR